MKAIENILFLLSNLHRDVCFTDIVKLISLLLVSKFFPGLFRKIPIETEVKFSSFWLKFRIGQGELTPYFQIKAALEKGLIPQVSEDWSIIDCGSNIGIFSLFCKDASNIIAVECNPDCVLRLKYNFTRNLIRGVVLENAVSSRSGKIKINISDNNTVLSKVDEVGQLEVSAITIDEIVQSHKIRNLDLLKLDIEGHELEALKGASMSLKKHRIKRIYTEVNDGVALKSIDEFLEGFDFLRVNKFECNALYVLKDVLEGNAV